MNKVLIMFCFLLTLFFFGCNLFNDNKANLNNDIYPPIWEYDFKVGYFSSIDPVLFKDKILYSSLDEKRNDFMANSTLEAFDKETGNYIWKWDETVDKPNDKFYFESRYHVFNDVLYISTGLDYAINLNTGLTQDWMNNSESGGQAYFGNENKIYAVFNNAVDDVQNDGTTVKTTSTDSFDWKSILENYFTDTSAITLNQILFDKSNLNLIYLPFTFGYFGVEEFYPGLIIYSLKESRTILEEIIPVSGSSHFIDNLCIIDEEKMYLPAYGKIISINKNTAELLWQTKVNGNTSASGILFPENNLLYVNTEFGVYCLDPETGAVIWSELNGEKEGNSSRMQYHKDVIYYIGGGMFHARDANTGEKLLFFEAPSFAKDGGAFFQPVMTIDQENDKIYTASYTHAYCYPTLR